MEDVEEENTLLKDKIKMLEELAVSANSFCSIGVLLLLFDLMDSIVLFFRPLRRILRK